MLGWTKNYLSPLTVAESFKRSEQGKRIRLGRTRSQYDICRRHLKEACKVCSSALKRLPRRSPFSMCSARIPRIPQTRNGIRQEGTEGYGDGRRLVEADAALHIYAFYRVDARLRNALRVLYSRIPMAFPADLAGILAVSALAASLLALAAVGFFWFRLSQALRGKEVKSLEDVIVSGTKEIARLAGALREAEREIARLSARSARSVRHVPVSRFDAFAGTGEGGAQSFAVGLLSDEGDGVVLSSIYTRDRMRVYAKPVSRFASRYELSDEEREVIADAKKAV